MAEELLGPPTTYVRNTCKAYRIVAELSTLQDSDEVDNVIPFLGLETLIVLVSCIVCLALGYAIGLTAR